MSNYADSVARPIRTLTEAEQRQLLRTTGAHVAGWRDHCIFSIALGVGLRQHEILALNVSDVFDEGGRARRRLTLRVFKRSAQDPTPQEVLLPDTVRAKLERLLALRRRSGETMTAESPVFVSQRGTRLSARQLRHAFGVWQERAGFERRFNVHALRHSSCTNIYRATKDIRLTQRFARHRSIVTTMIYTHTSDEELARAVEQLPC